MRKISFIFVVFVITIISLIGCNGNKPLKADDLIVKDQDNNYNPDINEYTIEVGLDTEDMSYTGKQRVIYINNTRDDLEEIYFHLYPNAFKTLEDRKSVV